MALYLQWQAAGTDPAQLLAAHADLHDLLLPLLQPAPDGADETGAGRPIGDFELVREVGRGGMGVVHEARQRSLGRRVALKVLHGGIDADPTRLARFRREAVILARLEHPHIVRVFDAGEDAGHHWLAMEFVQGESLDQRLQRLRASGGHRGSSLRVVVQVALAVAEALEHVHAQGILHRDVKPSNVLLADDGRMLLSDFGLARDDRTPTLTHPGLLAGTPHYLAPEYLKAGTMTPAADVWALGALLYEAVTLVRPFDGPTNDVVMRQVVQNEPVDPRRRQPGLHRDLAAIVHKALEKDPGRRYGSMAAFAADLRAFLDLRPTVARPPTRSQRLERWIRREPLRALLAGAVVLLVGLGTFVLVRLPMLQAGERAAHAAEYESSIAEGFVRRGDGNRERAEAAARRAHALRPESGEAIVVVALTRLRFDSPAAALQELEGLTLLPHDDDDACQRLRALILGRLGRADERDALLGRLGAPATQMGLLLAAGLLVEQRTPAGLAEARRLISLATRIAPPRLLVHAQWSTLAGPEERVECADALLRLWPEHPFALHLAATHLQWSDPARALALQQQALDRGLQDQWAQFNLAAYADKAGAAATAVAAARQAMADPQVTDERRPGLLQILTDRAPEQVDAAVADWLRHFPDSPIAPREHGKAMSLRGEHERAVAMLRRLAERRPEDFEAWFVLAWALQNASRWAESAEAASRLIALAPQEPRGHALQMRALEEQPGQAPAMLAELRRWAAVAATDGEAWREVADRLLLTGDPQHHAEALRAAMRADQCSNGQDPASLELLAKAHAALGETAAAAAVRERLAVLQAAGTGR